MIDNHYQTCIIGIALVLGIVLGMFAGYNLKVVKVQTKVVEKYIYLENRPQVWIEPNCTLSQSALTMNDCIKVPVR